jgi:hypothetical protein
VPPGLIRPHLAVFLPPAVIGLFRDPQCLSDQGDALPLDSRISAWRSLLTICSAENSCRFMTFSLNDPAKISHSGWIRFGG